MPIFKSAYDTTIGNLVATDKIDKELKYVLLDYHLTFDYNLKYTIGSLKHIKPLIIDGASSAKSEVPLFQYPYFVRDFKGTDYAAIDVRPFIVRNTKDGNINVRNSIDFDSHIDRLAMSMIWNDDYMKEMRISLEFAGTVFAYWLSESISKRFALDPKDQIILSTLTYAYYQSLFMDKTKFDESGYELLTLQAVRNLKVPGELAIDVINKIDEIKGIDDYCRLVETVLNNVRVRNFNTAFLINLISTSWFGVYAKENLAVALEFPPIWVSIVYTSLFERTFKNSIISRVSERYGKGGKAEQYMMSFKALRRLVIEDKDVSLEAMKDKHDSDIINSMIKSMKETD